MRPIPTTLRDALERQRRMKSCAVALFGFGPCDGRIEWHHVFRYAGRQINEDWAIHAACSKHHHMVDSEWMVRDAFMRAALRLASEEDLAKYPKKDWAQLRKSLGVV